MFNDNDTRKNQESGVFHWVFTFIEGRVKFVFGAFWFVLAILFLNMAWVEMSGKKRSMVQSLTATGVVEVLDSTVWILPKSTLESKLDSDRIYHEEDIIFEYTLDRRFYPESRIKSYRSKRRYEYFHLKTFWEMVRDDPYFRTEDFKLFFNTELLELRKAEPARFGSSFQNLSVPRDAPREQRSYMGSTFDQFWVWFDRPLHALAMEWLAASGPKKISVRYNPDNPDDFLDEATFEKAAKRYSTVYSVFTGGFYLVFGTFALLLVLFIMTEGMKKRVKMAVFIVVICTIPFLSPYLQTIMDYVGIPKVGKFILQDMSESMDTRLEIGFLEEVKFDESDYTLFPIDVASSRYKNIYGLFKLSNTPEKNTTYAAAMQDISSQITSQIKNLPSRDLFPFYRELRAHMGQNRLGWVGPFLQSTTDMAVDTSRSANLRSWAISVLSRMSLVLQDPEFAEFMYSQYISCKEDVRKYWRRGNSIFYLSSSFREDLNSPDPVRIKRALHVWMKRHLLKEKIEPLVPRLKTLTQHPDPEIREMACSKWDSRKDLGER